MQENTDKQFNDLRNQINNQNEYFKKETETLKKKQIDILELKNSGVHFWAPRINSRTLEFSPRMNEF